MGKRKNKQQQRRQQLNSKKQGSTKVQQQQPQGPKKEAVPNTDNDDDFAYSEDVNIDEEQAPTMDQVIEEEEEEIIEFITPGAKEHFKDFPGNEFNFQQFVPEHFSGYDDYDDEDDEEEDFYDEGDYDDEENEDDGDDGEDGADDPEYDDGDATGKGRGRRLFGNFFNPFNFGIHPDNFSDGDEEDEEDEYEFGSDIDSDEYADQLAREYATEIANEYADQYAHEEAKDYIKEMIYKIAHEQRHAQNGEEEEEEEEEEEDGEKQQQQQAKKKKQKQTSKKKGGKKKKGQANESSKSKDPNKDEDEESTKKDGKKAEDKKEGKKKDKNSKPSVNEKNEEEEGHNEDDEESEEEYKERDDCDPLMMQFFQAVEGGIRSCAEEANRIKPRDEDSVCAFIASIDPNIISMGIGQILIPIIHDWKVPRAASFIYHSLAGGDLEDYLGMLDVRYGYNASNKYRLSTVFGGDGDDAEAKATIEKLAAALHFYVKLQKLTPREVARMLNTAREVWNEPIHSRLFCGVVSALTKAMSFMDGGLILRLLTDRGDGGASWTSDFQVCFAQCTAAWSEENKKALAQRIPGVLAGWPKVAIDGAVDGINGMLPAEYTPYLPIQENIISLTDNGDDEEEENGECDDDDDGIDVSSNSKSGKKKGNVKSDNGKCDKSDKVKNYDDVDDDDDDEDDDEDYEDYEDYDDNNGDEYDDDEDYDEDDDINSFGFGNYGGFVNFGPGGRDENGYIDLSSILVSAMNGNLFYDGGSDEDEEEEDDVCSNGPSKGGIEGDYGARYNEIMTQFLNTFSQNIGSGNIIFERDTKPKSSKSDASKSSSQQKHKTTKKGRGGNSRKKH